VQRDASGRRARLCGADGAAPFLESSPLWFAFRAGQELAKTGRTAPTSARISRGYSIRLETAGGASILARFGRDLALQELARL
jgi:hypothetical protein